MLDKFLRVRLLAKGSYYREGMKRSVALKLKAILPQVSGHCSEKFEENYHPVLGKPESSFS